MQITLSRGVALSWCRAHAKQQARAIINLGHLLAAGKQDASHLLDAGKHHA
jgi:hypothetical protein